MSDARRVNLDHARKARAELQGDPPSVTLGGVDFTLPRACPASVLVGLAHVRSGDLDGFEEALAALFGEDHVAEVLRLGLELEDIDLIIEGAYGDDPGEASASGS